MATQNLTLGKLALFEIKKEKDDVVSDLIGNKIFNLYNPKPELIQLISVLKRNIEKRIISLESEDRSKTKIATPAIKRFDDLEGPGRPAHAIVLPLEDKKKQVVLNKILTTKDDKEFRINCATMTSFFTEQTKYPKGVLGFVQFTLKLHANTYRQFLVVLITDFSLDTMTVDDEKALKYLERTFKHDFRTTMLYPHLIVKTITSIKKTIQSHFDADNSKIKIHSLKDEPAIYTMVGASTPRDPQKEVEKLYKTKSTEINNLQDLKNLIPVRDRTSTQVTIQIGDGKFKVGLETFMKNFELFRHNDGSGIFVRKGEVEVFLGNRNLLDEQKISFKSLKELLENDKK